jgi:hypothetical protein
MAEYKAIHGTLVEHKTSDPLGPGITGGTWATGGALNTGRTQAAGSGTQTASIFVGGTPPTTDKVEQYDGSSWTEITEVNTGRAELGASTVAPYTATLVFGGHTGTYPTQNKQVVTEYWNGSSWTELGDLNTARLAPGGAGTAYTAALCIGGYDKPPGNSIVAFTESWNGSSWTEVGDLNLNRYYLGATGSSTAATAAGGEGGSPVAVRNETESWDGSSWTDVGDLPNASNGWNLAGATSTNLLAIGGSSPSTHVAYWNGTVFAEATDLSSGRVGGVGTGTTSAALYAGGPSSNTATEEYVSATISDSIKTEGQVFYRSDTGDFKVSLTQFGTGAWASGGNMSTTRAQASSAGTQTAALVAGGAAPPSSGTVNSEEYNGSAWAEGDNLNNAVRLQCGRGTQTSALSMGGSYSGTESYNGTSWTETGHATNTTRSQAGAGGSSNTSGIFFGGEGSPFADHKASTEVYNGSSWTEVSELNTGRTQVSGSGTATSAIAAAGHPGSGYTQDAESWDGTSWTEIANLNTGLEGRMGFGADNTTAFVVGGRSPYQAITEQWNGSSWTEVADMSTARYNGSGMGSFDGLIAGGSTSGTTGSVTTEEFTVPESISNLTITD